MTAKILPFRRRPTRIVSGGSVVQPPGDPTIEALARALLPGLDPQQGRRIVESGVDGQSDGELERWLWHELLRSTTARELLQEIGALLPEEVTARVLARLRILLGAGSDGG